MLRSVPPVNDVIALLTREMRTDFIGRIDQLASHSTRNSGTGPHDHRLHDRARNQLGVDSIGTG